MSLLIKDAMGTGRTCLHRGQQHRDAFESSAGPVSNPAQEALSQAPPQPLVRGKPAGFPKVLEPQGSRSAPTLGRRLRRGAPWIMSI